ncbi:hypothetical protein [Pyrococcus yayanosii]|uniref:Uncharacterized protein n=1 Tax=Pyrococcus yayanosii (strain CH1 / JCM 16557) TaxID=529709 RepID=F8AG64_PYRYC|nr:hypothetical protein [Pyrococcus yayanosii]AEH23900.1 hypothetical protein PYCH_01980 [Pyrococcus yayanosii CH1]
MLVPYLHFLRSNVALHQRLSNAFYELVRRSRDIEGIDSKKFMELAEEVIGKDLTEFFKKKIYGT